MTLIVSGSDLALVFASGESSSKGGAQAVREFNRVCIEMSGEEPEYGDAVEFNLGRLNEHLAEGGDVFDRRA